MSSRDRVVLRAAADQLFSRAAGAALVGGNAVRVLRDAAENYPVWEGAIDAARSTIHLEMYIVHFDRTGRRFVDLLARKARDGVTVRVIYDWFGCGFGPASGLFRPLHEAGVEVRAFNPPSFRTAFGWVRRNHRKLITVDGRVAFISGLCLGEEWEGRPERRLDPWRDTGVEIRGPAVAHAEQAFADSWRIAGGTLDPHALPDAESVPSEGDVHLRLIPTEPFTANLLRMDLLVSSLARKTLWITDAYFIGTGPYLEALRRTAQDGVDVRILLPQGSDVSWTVPMSRSMYRPLLEAGVRIFEWNGTMVHAKTAVADSQWARIGSTNLNLNSWIGNWELDVAVEDTAIASILEGHFLEDLDRATEIVMSAVEHPHKMDTVRGRPRGRTARRVVRTVTGVGHSVGAVMTGSRALESFEVIPIVMVGLALAALSAVLFVSPRLVAWPVGVLFGWAAITFLAEAWTVWRRRGRS